jgi:hypothetical protein
MTETITKRYCDAQGCKKDGALQAEIPAGWNCGPPEGGPWSEQFDFCPEHMRSLVNLLAVALSHRTGKALVKAIRDSRFLDDSHASMKHLQT